MCEKDDTLNTVWHKILMKFNFTVPQLAVNHKIKIHKLVFSQIANLQVPLAYPEANLWNNRI